MHLKIFLRIFVLINYKNEDMKKLILTLAFLGMSLIVYPKSKNNFDVRPKQESSSLIYDIMKVLKLVESRGDSKAVSKNKRFVGILQIGKQCIQEVNRLYGTTYTHKDAFVISHSEDIFVKAITAGINRYKRLHKKDPSEEDIVRMWNGGIYNGYSKASTKKYYNKYLRYKKLV